MKESCRKRLIVSVLMVVVLTLYSALTVFAQTTRWSHFSFITADMDVNDYNYATVDVLVRSANSEVASITVLLELQQLDGDWETIMEWEESENDSVVHFIKDYGIYKGYSYRLLVTATAYDKNGNLLEEVEDVEFGYGYYH